MADTTTVEQLCDDLAAEHAVLDCIVSVATPEQWATLTPAEPWTVRDQIAHLAFFDERAMVAVTDEPAFTEHLAEVAADVESGLRAHLDLGGRDGPGVLAHWRTVRGDLLGHLRRLPPSARVPWYGPPMSARMFITARLMETWAHGQDVVDALGVVRAPSGRLRHIAFLGVRTFAWSHQAHGLAVPESPPVVELTAPDGSSWSWNEGGDGRVTGPAVDFCLVVTQRRNVADTALEVVGDTARTWMEIAQAFAGPPGTGRAPGAFPSDS